MVSMCRHWTFWFISRVRMSKEILTFKHFMFSLSQNLRSSAQLATSPLCPLQFFEFPLICYFLDHLPPWASKDPSSKFKKMLLFTFWPCFSSPHTLWFVCTSSSFHLTTFLTSWSAVFFLLLSNPCCQMDCSVVWNIW